LSGSSAAAAVSTALPVALGDSLGVAAPVEQALSENKARVAPKIATEDLKFDKKFSLFGVGGLNSKNNKAGN
jgi:hypothetical protein